MRLRCLTFKLGPVRSDQEHIFLAKASDLGTVKIKTKEDLSRSESLILIHPWIDFLLDRRPLESVTEAPSETTNGSSSPASDASLLGIFVRLFSQNWSCSPRPLHRPQTSVPKFTTL